MRRIIHSKTKKNSFGFTLVELILTIAILGVILAIAVPSLFGFIKKARDKQDLLDAKLTLTTIQTELSERYAKNGHSLKPGYYIIDISDVQLEKTRKIATKNGDINATELPFARDVLTTAGIMGEKKSDEPFCIVFGVGSNWNSNTKSTDKTTLKDKYTVYYLFYMRTKHSTPLFYYNGEWTNSHIRSDSKKSALMDDLNYFQSGPLKDVRLQYYCISNRAYDSTRLSFGTNDFWKWVRSLE